MAERVFDGLRQSLAIAVRELLTLLVTPLGYVVATLFLLQQGYDFAILLRVLNDPLAAPGPVMQYYFGGSFFIFWLPVIALCALVSMRLVAEERRQGTLEAMLTAPLRPSQIVVGKYLGALGFYVLLWLPTGIFYVLLRGAQVVPDPGPVASGYLGTFAVGASFLALGLVASAASRSQLGAAIAAMVGCTMLVLVGLLAPEIESPELAALVERTSLLAMMQELAQGIVDGRWLWIHAAFVITCLWAAAVLVDPRRDWQAWLQLAAIAVMAVHVAWWGTRHSDRDDWTGGQIYALSDRAREVLGDLPGPIDVRLMIPATLGGGRPNPVHGELREVLARMAEAAPNLRVVEIDPDRDRQQAETQLAQFGLVGRDLADGVVLVRAGVGALERRTSLRPDELVVYATGADVQQTGPRVKEFRGEEALLGAFIRVSHPRELRLCMTQGHGEPARDSFEPFAGYVHLEELIEAAGFTVETADLDAPEGLAGCAIVVVAGPSGRLPPGHVAAIERYAQAGGELLVLAGAVLLPGSTRLAEHGLEPLLSRYGIGEGGRVVVDPHAMPGGTPMLAFTLPEGWGDHPAVRSLVGRAVSLVLVRELEIVAAEGAGASTLLSVGEDGFAESDLVGLARGEPPVFDADVDRPGPIPVIVAGERGGSRVVVVGSDQFALNAFLREDVAYDHDRDLVVNLLGWLSERDELLGIAARPREHVKLVLRPEQLDRMTWVCLVGLPGFAIALGLAAWWRRRR